MSKATEDLTNVRASFEEFEKNMLATMTHSISKHGLAKTSDVLMQITHIRKAMKKLHMDMD